MKERVLVSTTLAQPLDGGSAPNVTPTPRLRPALVNGQRCWVECPSYCVVDHVLENERFLVDVAHASAAVDLVVPRQNGSLQLLASARVLMSDRRGPEDDPMVAVDFEDVQSLYLSPAEVEAAADRVAAFEAQLRALGRVAAGVESAA